MTSKDIKDVVDCLDYLKEKIDGIDSMQDTILDKINYIMAEHLAESKQIKLRLNSIYGCMKTDYLNLSQIKERIPVPLFDLFINGEVVLRRYKLPDLDTLFETYTSYPNISKYRLDKVKQVSYEPFTNEVCIYTEESEHD